MRFLNRRRATPLERLRAHTRQQRRLLDGYGPVELRNAEGCLRGHRAAKDARRAASGMPPAPAPRDPQERRKAREQRHIARAAALVRSAFGQHVDHDHGIATKDVVS